MRVIKELKKVTNILNKKEREAVNKLIISNFNEEEQRELIDEFNEVVLEELIYVLKSKQTDKEIKAIVGEVMDK